MKYTQSKYMVNQKDNNNPQKITDLIWDYIYSHETLHRITGIARNRLGKNVDSQLIDELRQKFAERIFQQQHHVNWAEEWKDLPPEDIKERLKNILNTSIVRLCIDEFRHRKATGAMTFTDLFTDLAAKNQSSEGNAGYSDMVDGEGPVVTGREASDSPDEIVLKQENTDYLLAGIATIMSEQQQQVIFCRLMLDMPFSDIAQKCNLLETTARTSFHRMRSKLAGWLEENREKPLPEGALTRLSPLIVKWYKEHFGEDLRAKMQDQVHVSDTSAVERVRKHRDSDDKRQR